MEVKTYCINKGTTAQYYALINAEDDSVLHYAPNNWRTEEGAKRWARKHGYTVKGKKKILVCCAKTKQELENIINTLYRTTVYKVIDDKVYNTKKKKYLEDFIVCYKYGKWRLEVHKEV